MQPSETVWTTLIEEHLGIIPVKFGQNPMSGFWEDDGRWTTDEERWQTNACHNKFEIL